MERQRLVFAIVKYLEKEAKEGNLKEEDIESLEVAGQCLETAFGLDDQAKEALAAKFPQTADLMEVFQEGLKHTKTVTPSEPSQGDKEEADQLKAAGNEFMKSDKVADAISCYTKAIALDNTNPVYYCNRAAAYNKLNKYEMAIEDCSAALRLDTKYSKAFNRKGVAHMALNQLEEAKAAFTKALELEPQNESYKISRDQCEQRLHDAQARSGSAGGAPPPGAGGLGGLNLGGMNLPAMLNNPALMNMAQSLMSNPSMQQMMANVMMNAQDSEGSSDGLASLLQAGQHLAQEVQSRNPELVEQLRQQMRPNSDDKPADGAGGES